MHAIQLKSISKRFKLGRETGNKELHVLDNLSFGIKEGEFAGIIGPNGCGKTTLLKMLLGIEKPDLGNISFFEKKPSEIQIGYVPQDSENALYPWLSLLENIAFAHSKKNSDSMQLSLSKMKEFNLEKYHNAFPYQLSGGLKRLAAIARATMESNVLLFDEPLNDLDYKSKMLVENALLNLRDKQNTAILVSHDIPSILLLCDKVIILSEKPTRIKAEIPITLGKRDISMQFSPEFEIQHKKIFEILSG